ncbi:hypothetical protein EVAR_15863_1 [Eumeta japonica]|uniref:Uncharacterized protein n=1 Tax=Eumeta variegata TaxID=151549 RepID=A0A4C1UEW9_EUMVA|nr:hypothetical protein EVAR_15863_1 [Eumeta japonica]
MEEEVVNYAVTNLATSGKSVGSTAIHILTEYRSEVVISTFAFSASSQIATQRKLHIRLKASPGSGSGQAGGYPPRAAVSEGAKIVI